MASPQRDSAGPGPERADSRSPQRDSPGTSDSESSLWALVNRSTWSLLPRTGISSPESDGKSNSSLSEMASKFFSYLIFTDRDRPVCSDLKFFTMHLNLRAQSTLVVTHELMMKSPVLTTVLNLCTEHSFNFAQNILFFPQNHGTHSGRPIRCLHVLKVPGCPTSFHVSSFHGNRPKLQMLNRGGTRALKPTQMRFFLPLQMSLPKDTNCAYV